MTMPDPRPPTDSLLDREHGAPLLFDLPPATEPQKSRNPVFTGAGLWETDPDRYRAILEMRARGALISDVVRALGVSRHTVYAVERRESGSLTVAQVKDSAAMDYSRLAALARETCVELLAGVDPAALKPSDRAALIRSASTTMGIAEERAQLLGGQATERVEQVQAPSVAMEEYVRLVSAIPVQGEKTPDKMAAGGHPGALEGDVGRTGDAQRALPAGQERAGVAAGHPAVPGHHPSDPEAVQKTVPDAVSVPQPSQVIEAQVTRGPDTSRDTCEARGTGCDRPVTEPGGEVDRPGDGRVDAGVDGAQAGAIAHGQARAGGREGGEGGVARRADTLGGE